MFLDYICFWRSVWLAQTSTRIRNKPNGKLFRKLCVWIRFSPLHRQEDRTKFAWNWMKRNQSERKTPEPLRQKRKVDPSRVWHVDLCSPTTTLVGRCSGDVVSTLSLHFSHTDRRDLPNVKRQKNVSQLCCFHFVCCQKGLGAIAPRRYARTDLRRRVDIGQDKCVQRRSRDKLRNWTAAEKIQSFSDRTGKWWERAGRDCKHE